MPAKKTTKSSKTKISDVTGIDFGTTSTKLVRLRNSPGGISLAGADVLPPINLQSDNGPDKLSLPKKMIAPYAAACTTGPEDHVRFMFISEKMRDHNAIRNRVSKSLGLGRDFRVNFSIVEPGKDGKDHKVLAASMPHQQVQTIRNVFPGIKPSLISLEIAGLAALNSFSHVPDIQSAEGTICYLEAGAHCTMLSFFIAGNLRLVRKFDYGSEYVQQRIQDALRIDEEEALSVLFEDATPLIEQSLDPVGSLLQEISISKKFVERNENSSISKVYASGGLSYSPYWSYIMSDVMGADIEPWNPFTANGIKSYPKGVQGVESMFAPAIGAAIALIRNS